MDFSLKALLQKQALPLPAKIRYAQNRIQEWYDYWDGNVYLSFSGGKDSTVLMDIIKKMGLEMPIVFVDTGLEYSEVRNFAMKYATKILKPDKSFKQIIEEFGYPIISKEVAIAVEDARRNIPLNKETVRIQQLRGTYKKKDGTLSTHNKKKWEFLIDEPYQISAKCCDYIKKKPCKQYEKNTGRKKYTGEMACESNARQVAYAKTGCNAFKGRNLGSKPLSIWLEQDILQYLYEEKIEYASVYGDIILNEDGKYETTGLKRTGCAFCGFGAHIEKEPNRFQQLKQFDIKKYEYCVGGENIKMAC